MPVTDTLSADKIKSRLEKVLSEIEAVNRKKLITVVEPGGPDKVIYVQPLDLRGKDPEEIIEVMEQYVIDTDRSQGFDNHKVGIRSTGQFKSRAEADPSKYSGPFGVTYRINTGIQEGEKEWQDLKRTIETHVDRLTRVPDPVPYHSEVNEQGFLDLRNISLRKEDVPVAVLENYAPLNELISRRDELLSQLNQHPQALKETAIPELVDAESRAVAAAKSKVFNCDREGCGFSTPSEKGLSVHRGKHSARGE